MDFMPHTRISALLDNSRLFDAVNSFENIIDIKYFLNKDVKEKVILLSFDTK
jgi:hypothetical protein